MRSKNIFWGVLLISIGTLFILRNLDILYFNWSFIWRLWPLLLVMIGIVIMPIKSGIKVVLSFLTIGVAIVFLTVNPGGIQSQPWWQWHGWEYHDDNNDNWNEDWDKDQAVSKQKFHEPYNQNTDVAVLKMDAAAGNFDIKGETDHLIEFDQEGNIGPYRMKIKGSEERKIIDIELKDHYKGRWKARNNVMIKLNPEPVWELDMNAGAADVEMDLSGYKIKNLDVDGGAAEIDIKLGDTYDKTKVNIDAGAASITIKVPESVGCEVHTSVVLSSRSFNGFDKIERGLYRTGNYDVADKKIVMYLDAAVSSLTVKRY